MAYEGLKEIFGPIVKRKIRRVEGVENLPSQTPFILAANHVGYLDPLALVYYIYNKTGHRTFYITSKTQWRLWGEHLGRNWLGMIPLHDDVKEKRSHSLDEAVKVIQQDKIVGIFPEGSRNTDQTSLLKGKTGAVRLALATGAPLIPIGIRNNTGRTFGQLVMSLIDKDKYIDFNFGPAIDLSEFKDKTIDKALLDMATQKLMKAIGRLSGKQYPY